MADAKPYLDAVFEALHPEHKGRRQTYEPSKLGVEVEALRRERDNLRDYIQGHCAAAPDLIGPTREELIEHCSDLGAKVRLVLDRGYTWSEDGYFCFPDGDIWVKTEES